MIPDQSEPVKLAIVGGFFAFITIVFQGVQARAIFKLNIEQDRRARELNDRADTVAEHVKVVADKAEEFKDLMLDRADIGFKKLDESAIVAKATHKLVNSDMLKKLNEIMTLLEWKAGRTGSLDDIRAATNAKFEYEDHRDKQSRVDAMPGSSDEKKGQSP